MLWVTDYLSRGPVCPDSQAWWSLWWRWRNGILRPLRRKTLYLPHHLLLTEWLAGVRRGNSTSPTTLVTQLGSSTPSIASRLAMTVCYLLTQIITDTETLIPCIWEERGFLLCWPSDGCVTSAGQDWAVPPPHDCLPGRRQSGHAGLAALTTAVSPHVLLLQPLLAIPICVQSVGRYEGGASRGDAELLLGTRHSLSPVRHHLVSLLSCLPDPLGDGLLTVVWKPSSRSGEGVVDRGRSWTEALFLDWPGALSVSISSVTEYTEGRGDWICGLIRRSLRLFSPESPQSRNCLVSVGVCLLVDVEPNGGVVALTSDDILAPTQTGI